MKYIINKSVNQTSITCALKAVRAAEQAQDRDFLAKKKPIQEETYSIIFLYDTHHDTKRSAQSESQLQLRAAGRHFPTYVPYGYGDTA